MKKLSRRLYSFCVRLGEGAQHEFTRENLFFSTNRVISPALANKRKPTKGAANHRKVCGKAAREYVISEVKRIRAFLKAIGVNHFFTQILNWISQYFLLRLQPRVLNL